MKLLIHIHRTVVIVFALAGCVFAQPPAAQQPAALQPPAEIPSTAAGATAYRVASGDVLDLKFFYNPELNETIQVRPDGRISLSLIGEVAVENRALAEVAREVETRYGGILNRPAVNIIVRTYGSQKIYVGGEVNRPASIPLVGRLTARDALIEAGGAKNTGAIARALLIRRGDNGQPVVRMIDLSVKKSKGTPIVADNIALQPFDLVLVPETKIAHVDRWVDQYLRQSVPITLTGGFSYLFNPLQAALAPQ